MTDRAAGYENAGYENVVDEIPGAYKDLAEVMRSQADLVEVVANLKNGR